MMGGQIRRSICVAVVAVVAASSSVLAAAAPQTELSGMFVMEAAATRSTVDQVASEAEADLHATGLASSSVGQLFSPSHSCSAAVVHSRSGRVAVTAAHCVYVPERHETFVDVFSPAEPGWITDLEFQPGREGADAPYGTWIVERMWVDKRWQSGGDPVYDVAFLRLADTEGRTVQDVVGAQGITFDNFADSEAVTALGYPAEPPFDGTSLRRCSTESVAVKERPYPSLYAMTCDMTGGSSGGPWLAGFDAQEGAGTVVAVTSGIALDDSKEFYGARLGEFATALYRAADGRSAS